MSEYPARFAERYDDWFGKPATTPHTVELLAALAGAGPVLELGIGTGRVALPLSARGLEVHGVDGSAEMVRVLRAKPGGHELAVTVGDFADVPVSGTYSLIFLAGGTFAELPDQDTQLRCLRNAAKRLRPGGLLVFDALLPEALCELAGTEQPVAAGNGDRVLCTRSMDRAAQRYTSRYEIVSGDGTHRFDVTFRYAGLGELDLMAQRAALRLRHRWGHWDGRELCADSAYHVSVYG